MKVAIGTLIILVMGFLTFCTSWLLVLGIVLVLHLVSWWMVVLGTLACSYLILPYLLKWANKE